jgi:hypothetical protein
LYRNDVLLDWARAGHFENQFLSAEQRLLGGPAFGTVRAVAASATLWEPTPKSAPGPQIIATEASRPAPAPEALHAATALSTLPLAHEDDALPEHPTGSVVPAAKAPLEPKAKTEPASKPALPPLPRAPEARPTTSVAKNAPPVRSAAKANTASPAATPVRLDEEAAPDSRQVKGKKEILPPDPSVASRGSTKATLDDAIRSAASRKTPKKKKSGASEYDPLNPDL